MSTKLNEVATHYSCEGWDRLCLVVVGTDCEILVDMFTKLFGPPEMLNPMDLKGPAAKKAHTEAKQYEKEALHFKGGLDTSKPTILYPISRTIPVIIGILSEYMPMVHYAEEKSKASGKFVTKTFYHCTICPHQSQNKDSTHNHTRRHLNVSLACSWPNCGKTYDAPNGLMAHIDKKHWKS